MTWRDIASFSSEKKDGLAERLLFMRTMVGDQLNQINMSRLDAYARRAALQLDLEIAVGEKDELLEQIEERRAAYLAFKEDKRLFLIEYINRQTQAQP